MRTMDVGARIYWGLLTALMFSVALLVGLVAGAEIDWALTVAVAALFASGYQSFLVYRFSKIDRAFSHSVYRSDRYLNAFDNLVEWFPELENAKPSPCNPEDVRTKLNSEDRHRRQINIALNHWGRFASEYYADVLDRDRAREILRPQFRRFFGYFTLYFRSKNPDTDKDTLCPMQYRNAFRLIDEWRVGD